MSPPRLTVILVARSGFAEVAPVLGCLSRQTIVERVELVLVTRRGGASRSDLTPFRFARSDVVELEEINSRGEAAGRVLDRVDTPFVALQENHAFPEPTALERILASWRARDAAVAPRIRSANPDRLRSLAMYLVAYGGTVALGVDRPIRALPYHASVFDRAKLERVGLPPAEIFHREDALHRRLIEAGHDLRICSEAVTWHINETRWRRIIGDPMTLARRFGSTRARGWSPARRLAYAGAAPLAALIRLRHLLAAARRTEDLRDRRLEIVPLLGLIAAASALAEARGTLEEDYAPPDDFEEHEFHIRGRLAGTAPTRGGVAELVADLPEHLP